MGEAKRSKQLDPLFGAVPKRFLDWARRKEQQRLDTLQSLKDDGISGDLKPYQLPKYGTDFTSPIVAEAIQLNFFEELNALENRVAQNWHMDSFNQGRLFLFRAISTALEIERFREYYMYARNCTGFVSQKEEIKKAGEMLNNSGGMKDMTDLLVWSFLPKSIHRTIDVFWDGIGEWKA